MLTGSVDAQRLSATASAEASPFLLLRPGKSGVLDVVFSYMNQAPGTFTFEHVTEKSRNCVLHLNVPDNDWYQRGIPGVTGSIDETAAWLRRVGQAVGAARIRTVGASMGGYAALLFGDMIGAAEIYAFSPVLQLGQFWLTPTSRWRDIGPRMPTLAARARITFGAFELGEYPFALACLQAGIALSDLHFIGNFHPGLTSIRYAELLTAPEPFTGAALLRTPHRAGLHASDVAMLAGLADRLARRDHAAAAAILGPLTRRDPANAGLLYPLGVHQVLAGWPAAARVSLRHARALLDAIGVDTLRADADLRTRSTRDYAHLLGFDALNAVHAAIADAGN